MFKTKDDKKMKSKEKLYIHFKWCYNSFNSSL